MQAGGNGQRCLAKKGGRFIIYKTPPRKGEVGFCATNRINRWRRLLSGTLGSFERINFLGRLGHAGADMGCQIAIAVFPFDRGFRAGRTIPARSDLEGTFTAFALLYDFMAYTAVISTALGRHKGAFHAIANGCTFH